MTRAPLDRFVTVVMPNLQRLTCTRCHWRELAGFRLVPDPKGADIEANYRSVLAHIDVDLPGGELGAAARAHR